MIFKVPSNPDHSMILSFYEIVLFYPAQSPRLGSLVVSQCLLQNMGLLMSAVPALT